MRQQGDIRSQSATSSTDQQSPATQPDVMDSGDVHVSNHDHQWGYDIAIDVVDEAGETVFEKRYYLQAGREVSELDALPPGEYEVRALMDNLQEKVLQCRIGPAPEQTVLIEVGNGALSLSQGVTPSSK